MSQPSRNEGTVPYVEERIMLFASKQEEDQ